MADCVVDTSVAVKWVLAEPDSTDAIRVMNEVVTGGGILHFLDIALVEAANAIWVRAHRGKHSAADAVRILATLRKCPTSIYPSAPILDDALAVSLQFDIAVYDACFVAAVNRLGCVGVTADAPLMRKLGGVIPSIKLLKDW
jgi:predicted nucleic acid-binding protein